MKKRLFHAKTGEVKVLGAPVKLSPNDELEILINGVDIFTTLEFEEVEINLITKQGAS